MGKNFIAIAVLAGLTFAGLPVQVLAQSVDIGIKDYKYDPPEVKVRVGDMMGVANSYNSLGFLHHEQGRVKEALEAQPVVSVTPVFDKSNIGRGLSGGSGHVLMIPSL